jgi:hypothetical protein
MKVQFVQLTNGRAVAEFNFQLLFGDSPIKCRQTITQHVSIAKSKGISKR